MVPWRVYSYTPSCMRHSFFLAILNHSIRPIKLKGSPQKILDIHKPGTWKAAMGDGVGSGAVIPSENQHDRQEHPTI